MNRLTNTKATERVCPISCLLFSLVLFSSFSFASSFVLSLYEYMTTAIASTTPTIIARNRKMGKYAYGKTFLRRLCGKKRYWVVNDLQTIGAYQIVHHTALFKRFLP